MTGYTGKRVIIAALSAAIDYQHTILDAWSVGEKPSPNDPEYDQETSKYIAHERAMLARFRTMLEKLSGGSVSVKKAMDADISSWTSVTIPQLMRRSTQGGDT